MTDQSTRTVPPIPAYGFPGSTTIEREMRPPSTT